MPGKNKARTYMLAGNPYDDRLDVQTDGIIIYGHLNYEQRAARWKTAGYQPHFMTGLGNGSYDDYISGKFDEQKHYHERQQHADGTRWERSPSLFQLVPTTEFIEYLKSILKSIIDSGTESIFLTEPEFAAETGYSSAFKEAWRAFYEQPWQDPWSSVQSRYMSGHLKQHLFQVAMVQLFQFAQKYAASKQQSLACYVALQSVVNYTHWGLVAPHSQVLESRHCNGILAMVSTKTARTPNVYQGVRRERTFETALIEYGSFVSLLRGTNRDLIFLQDPVEDHADYTWEDYKQNYEATVVASLMYPSVNRFLSVPWPKRIFTGQYRRHDDRNDAKKSIPPEYASEILVVNSVLKEMDKSIPVPEANQLKIGILISDSMMLQRGGPSSSDEDLSFFYGLAMPLVKHGLLPQPLPLEHTGFPGFLDSVQIVILSYASMKPMRPDYHAILAEWVKAGNILIYIDNLTDPFNKVIEWWNSGMYQYNSPAEHLFELLGLGTQPDFDDIYFVGRGRVVLRKSHPLEFARSPEKAQEFIELIRHTTHFLGKLRTRFRVQNFHRLRREPYEIIAVMDESVSPKPVKLHGRLIDLFDPELAYSRRVEIFPGESRLFFNLSLIDRHKARVIASASTLQGLKFEKGRVTFISKGPNDTRCITKLLIPKKPVSIEVTKNSAPYQAKINYERFRKILTLQYPNDVSGVHIRIDYHEPKYRFDFQAIRNWFSFSKQKETT